ncbi:hypothetical protein [Lentibacillus cibarius]|nr:hypothetical protein [Lentibacillus cibarius]
MDTELILQQNGEPVQLAKDADRDEKVSGKPEEIITYIGRMLGK